MKKRIAYTGYIVIVTVFFLYYLFPGDAVTAYLNYQISRQAPGVNISVKSLKPAFPPGLKFFTLDLLHRNVNIINADFLKIRPSFLSLFSKEKKIFLTGDLCDGNLNSRVRIANLSAVPDVAIEAEFDGIQISRIPAIMQFEDYQISGNAAGNLVFGKQENNAGTGNAGVTITDSAIRFNPALFGIEELTFKSIETDLEIINQRVTIKRLDVNGREASGSASGSIILQNPLNNSTVNIRGEINPHPSFLKELGKSLPVELISRSRSKTGSIPFRITGSLDHPNFSLK